MQLHSSTDPLLQQALDEQDTLGWDQFLLGRHSHTWALLQHKEYVQMETQLPKKANLPAHLKSSVFAKTMVQESIYITLNRWQVHNEVVHAAITAREYIRDRDKAKDTIKQLLLEPRPAQIALTRQISDTIEALLVQMLDRMIEWIATWKATKAFIAPSLITTYLTTT